MYKSKNNRKKTMERTTTKNSRKIQNNCRFCWEAPVQLLVHSLTRARVRLLTFFNRSPTHTSRPWLMTILHMRLAGDKLETAETRRWSPIFQFLFQKSFPSHSRLSGVYDCGGTCWNISFIFNTRRAQLFQYIFKSISLSTFLLYLTMWEQFQYVNISLNTSFNISI